MPNYEFRCEDCGPFERILALTEAAEATGCPECEGLADRVYSMPGVISTSKAVKEARRRNERGAEPKVSGGVPPEQPASRESPGAGRPWQISH